MLKNPWYDWVPTIPKIEKKKDTLFKHSPIRSLHIEISLFPKNEQIIHNHNLVVNSIRSSNEQTKLK
ncbi:hypothetical protein J45TS6_35990 [Paenibacillus sp. J45TS6]|nr:hypothetical protein J45TS6_35990 [Paenibacillus sp. J45TS6]